MKSDKWKMNNRKMFSIIGGLAGLVHAIGAGVALLSNRNAYHRTLIRLRERCSRFTQNPAKNTKLR
jgi:hypothetical protein